MISVQLEKKPPEFPADPEFGRFPGGPRGGTFFPPGGTKVPPRGFSRPFSGPRQDPPRTPLGPGIPLFRPFSRPPEKTLSDRFLAPENDDF